MTADWRHSLSVTPEILASFFERVARYLEAQQAPHSRVVDYYPPSQLAELLSVQLPRDGASVDTVFDMIEACLRYSVDTGHPQFFNQLFGGRHWPALLGEWTASVVSTSLYTYEMAPVATLMERYLIEKMGGLAGFQHPSGTFVTGGSNGNLMGMVAALHAHNPAIKTRGLGGQPPLIALVSEDSHFSYEKAAIATGIGGHQLWRVPVDSDGRLIPEALHDSIRRARRDGATPFFVGATAGTTIRGAFDPLESIGHICRMESVWFHVDASFGGSALLSRQLRSRLVGIEDADSMVWDAHKLMGVPLICSAFMINRRPELLRDAVGTDGIPYIYHDYDAHRDLDSGHLSLQCGRRNDVFKLWMMWMALGDEGYERWVDTCVGHATQVATIIAADPDYELVYPSDFVTVCFRPVPGAGNTGNQITERLRDHLARSGTLMVNQCVEHGMVYLRLVFLDPTRDLSEFRLPRREEWHAL